MANDQLGSRQLVIKSKEMRKYIAELIFTICFLCSIESTSQSQPSIFNDTTKNVKLLVQKPEHYSSSFIRDLQNFTRNSKFEEVELIDSTISFKGRKGSPIYFPSFPRIHKEYAFKTTVGSKCYELALNRESYSDIRFHIVLRISSRIVFDKKGIVIIKASFIQAGESYEDEVSSLGYSVFRYESEKGADKCTISISNTPSVFENQLKAKIEEITCADSIVKEMIDKRPTLRSKF